MSNTPVKSQRLALVPDEPPAPSRAPEHLVDAPLGLDWLHEQAVGAYLGETPPALAQLAAAAATALGAGTDRERNDARIRLAARMITVGRMQQELLELSLAAALARGDDAAVTLVSRVLDGVSKRLGRWLEEHRLSCSSSMRPVSVAVNAIGDVTITGER